MKISIRIDAQFMEVCGDASLSGAIQKKLPDNIYFHDVTEVRLVFPQSSTRWRANNGSDLWLVPEYGIMCLMENILLLQARGIEVVCREIVEDPI